MVRVDDGDVETERGMMMMWRKFLFSRHKKGSFLQQFILFIQFLFFLDIQIDDDNDMCEIKVLLLLDKMTRLEMMMEVN